MVRIELTSLESSPDEDVGEIAEELQSYKGFVPEHYRLEGHLPNLLKHVWYAQEAVYEDGPLSRELLRKVGVVVSMANGCPYCTGAYCSLLSTELAGGREAVERFQDALVEDSLSAFEADVLAFVRAVHDDPHGVSDGDVDQLRSEHGLSDAALVQLVYQVNLVAGYNRLTTVFDAEYDHAYPRASADRDLGDGTVDTPSNTDT